MPKAPVQLDEFKASDAKKTVAEFEKDPPIDFFLSAVKRSASSGNKSVEVEALNPSQIHKISELGYKVVKSVKNKNLSVISW